MTQVLKGEIASVVWYEQGHQIEVTYLDAEPDYLQGDERVIREMAEDEEMWSVPATEGIRRWVRL